MIKKVVFFIGDFPELANFHFPTKIPEVEFQL